MIWVRQNENMIDNLYPNKHLKYNPKNIEHFYVLYIQKLVSYASNPFSSKI